MQEYMYSPEGSLMSARVFVCSNIFSETTGPVEAKFHSNDPGHLLVFIIVNLLVGGGGGGVDYKWLVHNPLKRNRKMEKYSCSLKGKATLKENIIKMKDILFPNILVQVS